MNWLAIFGVIALTGTVIFHALEDCTAGGLSWRLRQHALSHRCTDCSKERGRSACWKASGLPSRSAARGHLPVSRSN
jgi:hypothetical protein